MMPQKSVNEARCQKSRWVDGAAARRTAFRHVAAVTVSHIIASGAISECTFAEIDKPVNKQPNAITGIY